MDRRHQRHGAFLSRLPGGASSLLTGVVIGWVGALLAHDQSAPNQAAPSPKESATPWVQASSPAPTAAKSVATPPAAKPLAPATSPTPEPPKPTPAVSAPPTAANANKPAATPAPSIPPKPSAATPPPTNQKQAGGTPSNPANGAAKPSQQTAHGPTVPSPQEIKAKMLREQQNALNLSPVFGLQALLPSEFDTFNSNARIYNKLPPEEQGVIRKQAGERIREETEQAYNQSGLNLSDDQREVFALRYRQERRRLERRIQERATRERQRRVPEIIEQLRQEFGRLNPAVPGNPPPKNPVPESSTPAPVNPAPGSGSSSGSAPGTAVNNGEAKPAGRSSKI